MANFEISYAIARENEGGYANDTDDKGGETYKGIARNFNKDWKGWAIIDKYKAAAGGVIKFNTVFKDAILDELVRERYKMNYWNPSKAGLISSQEVANIYFDMYINAQGNAVKLLKQVVNVLGKKIPVNMVADTDTMQAVNALNTSDVYSNYKEARKAYYKVLAKKNPTNYGKFLKGWLSRVDKAFPDLKKKV